MKVIGFIGAGIMGAATLCQGAELSGDVFIVIKTGSAIKLPLVTVEAYERAPMEKHFEECKKSRAPLFEFFRPAIPFEEVGICRRILGPELMKTANPIPTVRGLATYILSEHWFSEGMPTPVATAKTDADGKFRFDLPEGEYVLSAESSRRIGADQETYRWIVRAKTGKETVHLANDNMTDTASPDSLAVLMEWTGESHELIRGRDRAGFLAWVEERKAAMPGELLAEKAEEERLAAERDAKRAEEKAEKERLAAMRQRDLDEVAAFERGEDPRKAVAARINSARLLIAKNPKRAHAIAVEQYPSLGVAGSPLNREFLARVARLRAEKSLRFSDPAWPLLLAAECEEAIRINTAQR